MRAPLVLMLVLALVPLGGRQAQAATDLAPILRASLDRAVDEFAGDAAVVVAGANVRYARNDGEVFPSASLYKLGVMVEAYRQAEAGIISLDDTYVTVTWDDVSVDPSNTYPGVWLSVRDAVERMITVSDNGPAHALLRLLGTHAVNATTWALGMRETRINTGLPWWQQVVDYNTTSARDLETLFSGLENGTIVSPAASAEMVAVLLRQQINDRLPAGLPADARLAHKTGNLDLAAHDAGILMSPFGPRILVVLTRDFWSYDDVVRLSARVAASAYDLPADRLAAHVESSWTGLAVRRGGVAAVPLTVTNASTFEWGPLVRLGAHWRAANGDVLEWDAGRVMLPSLSPGGSVTIWATAVAPTADGVYLLEWELLDEGLAWSGDSASVRVVVAPSRTSVVAP